jgi:hypothetical protein
MPEAKSKTPAEEDEDGKILQEELKKESGVNEANARLTVLICILVGVFVASMGLGVFFFKKTYDDMYKTYISNTKTIVQSKEEITEANSWERLQLNDRKERLRTRYYEIIKYYTIESPINQKMSDDQLLSSFNVYFDCIYTSNSINFFLPLAYLKIRTNFNPNYTEQYRFGIAAFYIKEGQDISNLPIVKDKAAFQVAYKGRETLQNPTESLRLLVARMDDLMRTFNNREDWVIFALTQNNEYEIIEKYWENGKGEIPEKLYKEGMMRNVLNFYYAFKNWKVPVY